MEKAPLASTCLALLAGQNLFFLNEMQNESLKHIFLMNFFFTSKTKEKKKQVFHLSDRPRAPRATFRGRCSPRRTVSQS